MPTPPPGFVLDQPYAEPPPGFVIDEAQQPAAPAAPGMLEQAWDVARPVLFPHPEIAGAVMGQAERAGEQLTALPGQLRDALDVSGTHYRTLAHGVGLADAPEPDDAADYRQAVIDALLTTGGGALGRAAGANVGDVVKYIGRGFRSVPGAERFVSSMAPHVGPHAGTASLHDLIWPAITGGMVGAGIDAMDPTPWELTDKSVAGAAGVGAGAVVARNTLDDLMLSNPRFRSMMMSPSAGRFGAATGAVLGHMLTKSVGDLIPDAPESYTTDMPPEGLQAPPDAIRRFGPPDTGENQFAALARQQALARALQGAM